MELDLEVKGFAMFAVAREVDDMRLCDLFGGIWTLASDLLIVSIEGLVLQAQQVLSKPSRLQPGARS